VFGLALGFICLVAYTDKGVAIAGEKYLSKIRPFLLKGSWEFRFWSMYICPIDMVWQLHTKIADENAGMRHDMGP
jgi:hypothetical protein